MVNRWFTMRLYSSSKLMRTGKPYSDSFTTGAAPVYEPTTGILSSLAAFKAPTADDVPIGIRMPTAPSFTKVFTFSAPLAGS